MFQTPKPHGLFTMLDAATRETTERKLRKYFQDVDDQMMHLESAVADLEFELQEILTGSRGIGGIV